MFSQWSTCCRWSHDWQRGGPTTVANDTSYDHTALLWETDRAATRAIAHPTITREEWDAHCPGVSYQPPC
jgi:hypothetical protein